MRRGLLLCLCAVIALAGAAAASKMEQELTRALPGDAQAKPWAAIAGSTTCGEGEGLTEIYDGGYKKYTDNGVLAAAQRTYRKGTLFAQVILHRMKSPGAAQKLAKIKRGEFGKAPVKALPTAPGDGGGFTVFQPGTASAAVWSVGAKPHLCTVVISGRGADKEKPEVLAIAAVRAASR